MSLHWKIDECSVHFDRLRVRGWCHHASGAIRAVELIFADPPHRHRLVSLGQPSPDVAAALGQPSAENSRFDEWAVIPEEALGHDFTVAVTLDDGSVIEAGSGQANAMAGDPFHACWASFLRRLHEIPSGTVLEIGSRARSAVTRRADVPAHLNYVGMDILAGPNVDVVGDAHALEALFGRNKFVAAFSFSVFEHLAMPWKVALELNRVLSVGGIVFTQTHQTWPIHEEPWDFWRFSKHSWQTLFNSATGFEVVEAAHGDPARIFALRTSAVTRRLPYEPAYLGSDSIVRKTGETELVWPVPLTVAARDSYPAGEMAAPPR
jgi:hypothetical protein